MITLLVYLIMVSDETDDDSEDRDSDEDEDNEDQTIAINQPDDFSLQFGKVGIKNSSGTQFGNRSEYHGTFNVHNEYKICCNGAPNSTLPFSHIFPNGTIQHISQDPSVLPVGVEDNPITRELLLSNQIHDDETCPHHKDDVLPVEDEDNSDTRELLLSNQVEDDEPCPQHKDEGGVKLRRNCLLYVGAGAVIVFTIVIGIYFILCVFRKSNPNNNDHLPQNFTQRFISRTEWGADPPAVYIPAILYHPVPHVLVRHTRTDACSRKKECSYILLNMQSTATMFKHFSDITYNFLVGGDGYIYEGRGWTEVSEETPPVDCSAISVGFIGDFTTKNPPERQLEAFKLILDEGVRTNRLAKTFKMFMQKDVIDTESPGDALIQILTSWAYWTPFTKADQLCK